MDVNNSMSVLLFRRSKRVGKVRRRVQDLRIPSSSYYEYTACGSKQDLSHNESARLAADRLLSQGLEGYQEVLQAEEEVDFLSELEKQYFLENGRDANTDDAVESDHVDTEFKDLPADCHSRCSAPLTSTDSTVEENYQGASSSVPVSDDPSAEVFFQTDRSAAGMKDLVRQFLRKAKSALAVVMDNFSDPELLCDLLEASRKRNVSVHLLLDHLNLKGFVNMWQELKLISKNFPKVSVRSVPGQTYCAKTGRKLTGQIAESFIITDWDEVLTGTYSFTWLCGQVHRSLLVLIKGSSVSHFHQEFLRLHSSSEPVPGFVTFITLPKSSCLSSTSHKHPNTVGLKWKSLKAVAAREIELPSPRGDNRTLGAAGTQLLERNQTQTHGCQLPPAWTFSDIQSLNSTVGQNVELRGLPHSLDAMSLTPGQQNEHNQSASKTQHSLAHADGIFSQQKNKNMSTELPGFKPGIKTPRTQWDSSLNVYPMVEFPCDRLQLFSPPSPQPRQPNPSHQIQFRSPREYISNVQTNASFRETSKQDEFRNQCPLNSPSNTASSGFKPLAAGLATSLSPQQQADSKRFLSGERSKMPLHPVSPQLMNLTHWSQQKAAGPRGITRYNSFSGAHEVGQAAWRTVQNNRITSLGRSLSMTERCPADFIQYKYKYTA